MKEKSYRNVVISENEVSGEHNEYGSWCKFSGTLSLMRISTVMDHRPNHIRLFMRLADGYGAPGFFPSGYDWSGIRDSSETAIAKMDGLAKKLWGVGPWPWETREIKL